MLEENDRAVSDVGSAQQEAIQKIQQLELKQTERRMRREHLVSRIQENYQQDIESPGVGDDAEEISVEAMETELTRLRELILRMGEVNPAAIEEYETLASRDPKNQPDLFETIHENLQGCKRKARDGFPQAI
jgi:chromosome segregation ATPase